MAQGQTFESLGRVEAVRQLFEGTPYKPFAEPCFFASNHKEYVTTSARTLAEGVDFNLTYFPLQHLGYKAVSIVTGELYAVMSNPRTLGVVVGVSSKLDFEQISQLWSGIVSGAKEFGYESLSLDLKPSQNGLVISLCATGSEKAASAAKRSVAHSKDLICVSGSLGAAYLGQQVLEHRFGEIEKYKMFVGSYLRPELPPDVPSQFESSEIYPSFGYFVSSGLSDALLRLCRDSGLGAKVYADKIPFEGNTFTLGKELDIDPVSAAMNGGDDCRLLFTVPILQMEKFRHDFQAFDIIGHLAQSEVGAVLVTPDGLEHPVSAQGWR